MRFLARCLHNIVFRFWLTMPALGFGFRGASQENGNDLSADIGGGRTAFSEGRDKAFHMAEK